MSDAVRPPAPSGPDSPKYLYGVIAHQEPCHFGPTGVGEPPAQVYTIAAAGLAAVVSDVAGRILDPTAENVLTHERVLARVMQEHTVIPVAFGHTLRGAADACALLEATAAECRRLLDQLECKIELGLQVFWRAEAMAGDLGLTRSDALLDPAALGEAAHAAAAVRREHYREQIFAPLAAAAVAARLNDPVSPRQVLNAAFLVERTSEAAFDQLVERMAAPHGSVLTFSYSGPWPPHNFVTVRLTLE